MGMCVFAMFQRCSSERSDWYSIDKGICSVFYGSGVRRLSGLSVLGWLSMYCQCFNAARLRGLVLIWVYFRCFMEALLCGYPCNVGVQCCSSERSGIDLGVFSVFYGSVVRRLSGLSVLVWLCMY